MIMWVRLVRTVWRGMREDQTFRELVLSVLILLGSGTTFYALVEEWNVIDAFYFSVLTLATVGYGDLVPTTTGSKLFTVAYVLFGVGLLAAFITEVASRRRRQLRRPD